MCVCIYICICMYIHESSTSIHFGIRSFPGGSAGNESACNDGDLGSIPVLGRSPGEGNGYPLQYYGLENSMDPIVHGVAKSQREVNDFHFHFGVTQNYI